MAKENHELKIWRDEITIRPNYRKWLVQRRWSLKVSAMLIHGIDPKDEYVWKEDDNVVFKLSQLDSLRIPLNVDTHSGGKWTHIPEESE